MLFLFLTCLYHLCVFILADDGSRARLEYETCTRKRNIYLLTLSPDYASNPKIHNIINV